MPEGHTVHRLAAAFDRAFGGQRVRTSSPQGRFSEAAQLDGMVLLGAEAVGKHLFLPFAPAQDVDPGSPVVRHVHIHLGLYGSWTFAGDPGFADDHAIGAPRLRIGEQEEGFGRGESVEWRRLVPRPTVRLRIAGPQGLADLTGPTACEIMDAQERQAVLDRLGPDPLRPASEGPASEGPASEDAARRRFVDAVRRSRTTIGALLMNQKIVAGIGNIYRAELLFRARLDPFMPGRDLSVGMLEEMWEDLVALMNYGARTGRIVTTQPEHRQLEARLIERSRGVRQNSDEDPGVVPREESFYVYHRQTLPCRLCGTTVRSAELSARTVFWCPRCQTVRRRRAGWTREHPAAPWALDPGTPGEEAA